MLYDTLVVLKEHKRNNHLLRTAIIFYYRLLKKLILFGFPLVHFIKSLTAKKEK